MNINSGTQTLRHSGTQAGTQVLRHSGTQALRHSEPKRGGNIELYTMVSGVE